MPIRLALELFLDLFKYPHPLAQLRVLVLKSCGFGFQFDGLRAISCLQRIEITLDAFFDLLLTLVDFPCGEVAIPDIDSLDLAAVDGHQRLAEQLELSAQRYEAATYVANASTVVSTEVSNRLEVGGKAAGESHQLDIALALALKASAQLHPVEVAIDVDLQQHRWEI